MTCKNPCKWYGNHAICIICEETGEKHAPVARQDSPKITNQVKEGITARVKTQKYRNKRFVRDGEKYNSEKEYRRHQELKAMQAMREISGLRREVPFELAGAVILNGRKKPAIRYYADFTYYLPDIMHVQVEDVKSPITRKNPIYRCKKHLMMSVHGLEITEI